jgi:NADP-dependent 3-hydroxy acid dehydrogenase YdfG
MSLVIVTGGSRGLGFETAKVLRAQGHQIVLVAKDEDRLAEAAVQLDCTYRAVDLADIDAAKKTFEEVLENIMNILSFREPYVIWLIF